MKNELKNSIEYSCFFNQNSTIKNMADSIKRGIELSKIRGRVRMMLDYQSNTPTQAKLLDKFTNFIPPEVPSNLYIMKYIVPSKWEELGLIEKENPFYSSHIEIFSQKDAEILLSWGIIPRDLIFRLNTDNYDEVLNSYIFLFQHGQTVKDFVNIKLDKNHLIFTGKMKESLREFLLKILPGNYYYNTDNGDIYNTEEKLPIKGIRSVETQLLKFNDYNQWANVTQLPNMQIMNTITHEIIDFEDLKKIKVYNEDEELILPKLSYTTENCENCDFYDLCHPVNGIPVDIDKMKVFSCDEISYWNFIYNLAKEICRTDIPDNAKVT